MFLGQIRRDWPVSIFEFGLQKDFYSIFKMLDLIFFSKSQTENSQNRNLRPNSKFLTGQSLLNDPKNIS